MAIVNANKVIMDNGDIVKLLADDGIVNITRSGTTFTATRQDGTTFTFTQQDNDTTTGTTYTAGNVPANTTFGTNGSIKNTYDGLNGSKAPKSEAIKNITRSGTTFTATRCDNSTFTFTQQDNNTTTGTSYNAGSCPDNTTFGTNGSIARVYSNLKSRLDNVGETKSSTAYSGNIAANGYCSNTLTLTPGKWLITTDGYVASGGAYAPFGVGLNTGASVRGFQPTWVLTVSANTIVYLWNILGAQVSAANLVIYATRIGV